MKDEWRKFLRLSLPFIVLHSAFIVLPSYRGCVSDEYHQS